MEQIAYCIKEVCAALGLSKASVYRAMARGDLKAMKFGSRTLVMASELNKFTNQLRPAQFRHRQNRKRGGEK